MAIMTHHNLDLHYRIDGDASLPTLVLSNSIGTSLAMWDAQMETLTRHFQVLRYDTRGHGRSSTGTRKDSCTMADLGNDVLALLDHAGIERAHVCGVSLGGMTSLWLGLNAPERVVSVIAAANAAYTESPAFWDARIDTVRCKGLTPLVDGVMERFFGPAFRKARPDIVTTFRQTLLYTSPAGYIACCAAIRDFDIRNELPRIHIPTLALAGTDDVASPPANSRAIAQNVPGGMYAEIAAAHLLNVEAPEAFTRVVVDFLTGGMSR